MLKIKKVFILCVVGMMLFMPLPLYATEGNNSESSGDHSQEEELSDVSIIPDLEEDLEIPSSLNPSLEPKTIVDLSAEPAKEPSEKAKATSTDDINEVVKVSDHEKLQEQLARTDLDKNLIIEVTQDIALSTAYAPENAATKGLLEVKNGTGHTKTLTTSATLGEAAVLTRAEEDEQSRMLFMGSSSTEAGTLILENIVFDGEGDIDNVESQTDLAQSPIIYLAGGNTETTSPKHLVIEQGTVLQNNIRKYDPQEYVGSNWINSGNGSAIFVAKYNTLTMNGGIIQNNFAPKSGGGVYLDSGLASFHLNGGVIRNNKTIRYGAGIYLSGAGGSSGSSFSGGIIQGNSTMYPASGDSDEHNYDGRFSGVFSRASITFSGSPQILDGVSIGNKETFADRLTIENLEETATIALEAGAVREGDGFPAEQLREGDLSLLEPGVPLFKNSASPIATKVAAAIIQKDSSMYGTPYQPVVGVDEYSVQWRASDPIDVSQKQDHVFAKATLGYNTVDPLIVSVDNPNYRAWGPFAPSLSGENAEAFVLSHATIGPISARTSATFTLSPKPGLTAGVYTATVTVTETAAQSDGLIQTLNFAPRAAGDTIQTFDIFFTVEENPDDPDPVDPDPDGPDPVEPQKSTVPDTGDDSIHTLFWLVAAAAISLTTVVSIVTHKGTRN